MTHIHILPDILSNKIAAGEVVERPSSVVKELVENAIDAGSSRITVEIEKGGRSLIRVSDDGSGMQPDDALLAIERYATSKIIDHDDLFAINTLGFRGEALPSIASVSRFQLVSRRPPSDAGTEISIEGGQLKQVAEIGAPAGTMVSVRDLFFNTPARRKFMKSISTEMGHIGDTLSAVSLGWPQIQFKLLHNKRVVFTRSANNDPFERVVEVLGHDFRKALHPLRSTAGDLSIEGWISDPSVNRSTAQKIFFFINGRYIRNQNLRKALLDGYRSRLMKGRYPLGVLYIKLPFSQLDVNVHPTKHEVRFQDTSKIMGILKAAVGETLSVAEQKRFVMAPASSIQRTADAMHSPPEPGSPPPTPPIERHLPPSPPPIIAETQEFFDIPEILTPPPIQTPPSTAQNRSTADRALHSIEKKTDTETAYPAFAEKKNSSYEQQEIWHTRFFKDLTLIGQLKNTYLLCQSSDCLILIDQHAAHERIVFENLARNLAAQNKESQGLLIPETLELGFREADTLSPLIPLLTQFGWEIEPFGGTSFIVKSVPGILADKDITPILIEVIEAVMVQGYKPDQEGLWDMMTDKCLAILACHGAIRARQALTPKQMQALLHQLDQCETPSHCPHGRPTWIDWSFKAIEKSFKRIL